MRPCFLAAVERKPGSNVSANPWLSRISARVAPLGRPIISRIFAPLLSARGALAWLAWAGLAAFLPALTSFFREALALPPLAAFWPLGAPFFYLRGGLLRRDVRAMFRNSGGVFGNSGFCVRHGGESFLRLVGA
jgi:hypothetical protein